MFPEAKTIKCAHCAEKRPAICFGCYEDCDLDPIEFACDECCGHGNEDGWCSPLEDLASHMTTQRDDSRALDDTNTFLRREIADAEKDSRDSRESELKAIAEKEEMQHARDCQYDDMVVYRDQLGALEPLLQPIIEWSQAKTTGFGPQFTAAFEAAKEIAALTPAGKDKD